MRGYEIKMPCYVKPTYDEQLVSWEVKLRHNSPTAEAFCELCKILEASNYKLPPKADKWWKEHKERDANKATLAQR